MPFTYTPLRYPGGKSRLTPYLIKILKLNQLLDGHYVEPYAGGAGLAISLLVKGYVRYVHLNDIDDSLYAFWYSVLNFTNELCDLIKKAAISVDEWKKQREIYLNRHKHDLLTVGFATLYLNRTNRSGILNAGIIGGKNQTGKYKIGARFNKETLIEKIKRIAFYKQRIRIYNQDACDFISEVSRVLPRNTLIYLDPPYYQKGQDLYTNFYSHEDHLSISFIVSSLNQYWMITYDNTPEIIKMYKKYRLFSYSLAYSAQKKYIGKEILIIDPRLTIPDTTSAFKDRTMSPNNTLQVTAVPLALHSGT